MTTTAKIKEIHVLLGFSKLAEAALLKQGYTVQTGLTGNTNYPTPPVDLTVFKTALDTYSADITASADGSKKSIAAKKKQAKLVVHMLRQLATYVEANTNGDMA